MLLNDSDQRNARLGPGRVGPPTLQPTDDAGEVAEEDVTGLHGLPDTTRGRTEARNTRSGRTERGPGGGSEEVEPVVHQAEPSALPSVFTSPSSRAGRRCRGAKGPSSIDQAPIVAARSGHRDRRAVLDGRAPLRPLRRSSGMRYGTLRPSHHSSQQCASASPVARGSRQRARSSDEPRRTTIGRVRGMLRRQARCQGVRRLLRLSEARWEAI